MKHKKPTDEMSRPATGFTLVELLVVIVIIAVLAGIGFPLATKIRSRALDDQCLKNLRSWGQVLAMYSTDFGGTIECRKWNSIGAGESVYVPYLSGDGSHESGYPTLAKMRCCPALKGKDALSGNGNSLTAYSLTDGSGTSSPNAKNASYNLSKIANPSRFVMMIETMGGASFIQTSQDYTSRVKPLTQVATARHKDRVVNALFGDFSVRSVTAKEIDKNVTIWTTF